MPDAAFLRRYPQVLDPLLEALALPRGARVLDVGCGDGELTAALAAASPTAAWLGVDRERGAVARASSAGARAAFEVADAALLPYADGQFDAAFCNLVLHLRSDRAALVREMVRVTRPGGRVVCSDADIAETMWFDPDDPDLADLHRYLLAVTAPRTLRIGRVLPHLLRQAGCVRVRARPGGVCLPGGPGWPADRDERLDALRAAEAELGRRIQVEGVPAALWRAHQERMRASFRRRIGAVAAGEDDPLWETVSAVGRCGSVLAAGERA